MKVCRALLSVSSAMLALVCAFAWVNASAEASYDELSYDEQALRVRLEKQSDDHLTRAKLVQLLVAKKMCGEAQNNADIIVNAKGVPEVVKQNLGLLVRHCESREEASIVFQFKPRVGYDSRPTSFSQDLGYSGSSMDAFPIFEAIASPIVDYYDPAALGASNDFEFSGAACTSTPCENRMNGENGGDEFTALSVGLVYGRRFELFDSIPSRFIVRNRLYNRSYFNNDHYNVNSVKSGLELNAELWPGLSGLAGVSWWYQKTAADLKFDSFSGHLGMKWQTDNYKASLIYERLRRDYNDHSEIKWSQSTSLTLLFSKPLFNDFIDFSAHYKYSDNEVSGGCQNCSLNFSFAETSANRYLDYRSVSFGAELEKNFVSGFGLRAGYRHIDYKGLSSGINSYQRFSVGVDKLISSSLKWDFSIRAERHDSELYNLDDRNVVSLGLGWIWDG